MALDDPLGLIADALALSGLVLLPVILLYTAWSYWVFRGKVTADMGYH